MLKNSRGFAHPILLVILSIVVLGTGCFTYTHIKHSQAVNKEKQLYATLDKQSTDYINAIAAKYPGKIRHERYCEYGSAKYGKGSLGCRVDVNIGYEDIQDTQNIIDYAETLKSNIHWRFAYDNTLSNQKYGSPETIKHQVYKEDNLFCSIEYRNHVIDKRATLESYVPDKTKLFVSAGCSGNALAEHYPVREH